MFRLEGADRLLRTWTENSVDLPRIESEIFQPCLNSSDAFIGCVLGVWRIKMAQGKVPSSRLPTFNLARAALTGTGCSRRPSESESSTKDFFLRIQAPFIGNPEGPV